MGHSLQAVALLVHAASSLISVPLVMRIHEGVVISNRDQRTLYDKMLDLLDRLDMPEPYYFLGDAYYACGKIITGLRGRGNHLISRMKSNAVAYVPVPMPARKRRGRPKMYGEKVALMSLFDDASKFQQAEVSLYGENAQIRYRVCDVLWRPAGCLIRVVAVSHAQKGRCVLMSTDTTLEGVEIAQAYACRFKIEFGFKQAARLFGTMSYHFWMRMMDPIRRNGGDQYLHRKPREYRDQIKRKLHAYHVFMQAGLIAQGLLQYLAVAYPEAVWRSFGSWLRTIRPEIAPSEYVTAQAMTQRFPDFLALSGNDQMFGKFILARRTQQSQGELLGAA